MKSINVKRIALTALSGLLLTGCGKTNTKSNIETELILKNSEQISTEETKEEINPFANLIEDIEASYCDDLTKDILKEVAYYTESDEIPQSIKWVLDAEAYDRPWYISNLLKEVCQEQKDDKNFKSNNLKIFNSLDSLSEESFVNYCTTYGNYKFYEKVSVDSNLYLVTDENDKIIFGIDEMDIVNNGSLTEFSDFLHEKGIDSRENYTIIELEEFNVLLNKDNKRTR